METNAILMFSFGVVLLFLGVRWLFVSLDSRLTPYLEVKRMICNWQKMLLQGPAQSDVVSAGPFSYRAQVQHFPGYYLSAQGPTSGSAARIQVPPDCVARLSYTDRWRHSRFLDMTRFCLRTDDGDDIVEFIARGRRWCFDFHDDNIRSQDGYLMNGQLAVHWHVPLPLEREDEVRAWQ